MQLLGRVNWWLPAWLDRILPGVQVEGADDHEASVEQQPVRELQPA
jgi:RND superfamily putative drug exporter